MTDLCDHREGRPASPDALAEEREGANLPCRPDAKEEAQPAPISPFRAVLQKLGPRFLPFADAATPQLPLSRLLRLSLFQVTVGMALVLLNGTLNRVMIVELSVPAWLVALMIALPLVFAPFRALLGFKSDTHRSLLGWKRVPYIWFGTLLQFGGLAIMPFALILLSGDTQGPPILGNLAVALAFLLVGAGLHTTQTAGLALATDLAPEDKRPRVVAFLYVMLLLGMTVSAVLLGRLLEHFSQVRLIEVIQGTALVTMALNLIALWKQEPRRPRRALETEPKPDFSASWRAFMAGGPWRRIFITLGLGTVGFSMQDILIEPYGGQVLHMTVGQTTALTAFFAIGALLSLALAAHRLDRGADPYRLAAYGVMIGLAALTAFCFLGPPGQAYLLRTRRRRPWLWQRLLRRRNLDRRDGSREDRASGPRPWRVGRRWRIGDRRRNCAWRRAPRRYGRPCGAGTLRPSAHRSRHRLPHCLSCRNCPAVRDARGHWPLGPNGG